MVQLPIACVTRWPWLEPEIPCLYQLVESRRVNIVRAAFRHCDPSTRHKPFGASQIHETTHCQLAWRQPNRLVA